MFLLLNARSHSSENTPPISAASTQYKHRMAKHKLIKLSSEKEH